MPDEPPFSAGAWSAPDDAWSAADDEPRLASDEPRLAAEDGRPLRADVALLEPAARDPDDARLAGVLEADRDAAAAVFGLAELPLLDLADVLVFGLAELLVLGFADRLLFGSSELLSFGFAEDRVLLLPGLDVAIFNAPFQFAHQVYPGP